MSMIMFNDYSYFVLFYTLAAPALPWLFARKRGASGIWGATWIVVALLVLFNVSLWPALRRRGLRPGRHRDPRAVGRCGPLRRRHGGRDQGFGPFAEITALQQRSTLAYFRNPSFVACCNAVSYSVLSAALNRSGSR